MPLIVICGYPCSGKTTFAIELEQYLRRQPGIDNVFLINEESEIIVKRTGYADSFAEKITRGMLKSAVNTRLDKKTFVILDSLNYIKGYRYELYCIARAMGTPMCVCQLSTKSRSDCIRWNQARLEKGGDGYNLALMEPLMDRFEAPQEKNRWDSPLFTINLADVLSSEHAVELNAPTLAPNPEVSFPDTSTDALETSVQQVDEVSIVTEPVAQKPAQVSSWKAKPKKIGRGANPVVASGTEGDDKSAALPTAPDTLKSFTIAPPAPNNPAASCEATIGASSMKSACIAPAVVHEYDVDSACSAVLLFLQTATVAAPNSSTVAVPHGAPDLLYTLTQTTDAISRRIVAHQRESPQEGSAIVFSEYNRSFTLHRLVSIAEITRVRQRFVRTNSLTSYASDKDVGAAFIDYLAGQL